jgi:hypothetical protein
MPRWLQFIIALVIGLALGLLYAWVISPVEYVDTAPDTLRADYRADYVLIVAEIFRSEQNVELAARRIALLGSQPPAEIANAALIYARDTVKYPARDVELIQNLVTALQAFDPAAGIQPP